MALVSAEGLRACEEKMRAGGVPDVAIATFAHYYRQLEEGASGLVPESEIEPVDSVPDADELPEPPDGGREALDRTVVIKLNGGLGTSMGMTKAKSLLPVKDGLSFLDVIARQVTDLRRRHNTARLPLVLMDSFATREDSLAALRRHPELEGDVPLDFVQNKEPKLLADDLEPARWPPNPELEWCPPGHGDIYTALVTSGMLDALLEHGYEHAFVSNSDNLGAILEPRILAWFAAEGMPFLMEVADRTEADRKGGHLAQRPDGRLLLREIAQTPEDDLDAFQDIARHRYFNTNTLWISLPALADALRERDNVLGLPMIVNRKTLDPTDSSSPAVLQLETAMGAAIEVFEGARALRVPRSRFAPVKTTNDLLVLRSDCYVLTGEQHVALAPERDDGPPLVDLDPGHYKLVADFESRFPDGPPSLLRARRFAVRGDAVFEGGVAVVGDVEVEAAGDEQVRIGAGTVLEG
jgi:UTP--glucose-1-phosphate uridylyltransferase